MFGLLVVLVLVLVLLLVLSLVLVWVLLFVAGLSNGSMHIQSILVTAVCQAAVMDDDRQITSLSFFLFFFFFHSHETYANRVLHLTPTCYETNATHD
jgi:hypothetical protein